MNRFFESLINLFFPPKCPFCGKVLDAVGICPACEKTLPWVTEEQVSFTEKDLTCAAPLWYEGAVREALLRFNFRGGSALAEPLGEVLARCAAEQFSGEFDTVTWVPVSRKRLKKRGYDQARLLAEAITSFNDRCAAGITADREKMAHNLHNSLMLVTALNPYIGYENAAKVAKKAYRDGVSLKEACVELGFLTAEKFDEVFHPEQMV